MSYMTVSTWRWAPEADVSAIETYIQKVFSNLSDLGALSCAMVRATETTGFVTVTYPDAATFEAARDYITQAREEAEPEVGVTMTQALAGEVRISA